MAQNGGFWVQNRGRDGAMMIPKELVLTFGSCNLCASFGENRSRNAIVRVQTDRQTRQTDGRTDRDKLNL